MTAFNVERHLIDRATVYASNPTTGLFEDVVASGVRCRLCKITVDNAGTARAELLSSRRLVWDRLYVMPENVQVEIDGKRWNFLEGTQAGYRDFPGVIRHHAADVIEQDEG